VTKPSRLLEAALEIQAFCLARQWRFAFIGGIAVQHWGEARLTRGADVELFTGIGEEVNYVDALLNAFESRVDHPRAFAEKHRVPLLRASNRIPLDVSLGALSFEEKAVDAARDAEIAPGVHLRIVSPAALVVFKVFAGRVQDWLDVEGIIVKSGSRIEWEEVRGDPCDAPGTQRRRLEPREARRHALRDFTTSRRARVTSVALARLAIALLDPAQPTG